LWKEWRDHRVTMAVFAAIVPLVSWPVQRYIFKFAEPEWTWRWTLPICVGLVVAVVAADLFAADLATERMTAFVALPVALRRHFTVRTAFLAAVAVLFTAWTIGTNVAIVSAWGKPGAAAALLASADFAIDDVVRGAGIVAAVVLLSALGVGGFRAAIGGCVLALIAYAASMFAAESFFPVPPGWLPGWYRSNHWELWATVPGAAVMVIAAAVAYCASRGLFSLRRRGAIWAATILVLAFGAPAAGAAWKTWRAWMISPYDPGFSLMTSSVSPDGRFVGVVGTNGAAGGCRSWIVPVDGGPILDWPRRRDYVAGWTTDGLAWIGRYDSDPVPDPKKPRDYGALVRPETGEVVERLTESSRAGGRIVAGWGIGPQWAQWLRMNWEGAHKGENGAPTSHTVRLWVKDGDVERRMDVRSVCATPTVGQVLLVTPDGKLALADLAGGEPRVVSDDANGLQSWLTGSADGRMYTVQTSEGWVVLDGTTWQRVAGPFTDGTVYWCSASGRPPVVAVWDKKTELFSRLVDVDTGREIPIDPALKIYAGYEAVQPLDDGRFVARSGKGSIVLLDANGKLIRTLFPPQGN
jgi:hypothetical protein